MRLAVCASAGRIGDGTAFPSKLKVGPQRWQQRCLLRASRSILISAASFCTGITTDSGRSRRQYNSVVGHRLRIREILDAIDSGRSFIGSEVTVCGWVRTIRAQKERTFIKINDGSTPREMQVIVEQGAEGFQQVGVEGVGAALKVVGRVLKSPASGQEVEISCSGEGGGSVRVLGSADATSYPLAKKRHSLEYLRTIAHLRPRSKVIGSTSRVRNALATSSHHFFQGRGFLYVNTPIITAADCEGAGEMFRVTASSPSAPRLSRMPSGSAREFFGQPAFLTVSGQLSAESFCCALGDVYTFGPTFRAEVSNTTRHLSEFWMLEPELAFADLQDAMDCAEDYLQYCAQQVLDRCGADLEFLVKEVDEGVVDRLCLIASEAFHRITYTDAVKELCNAVARGEAFFQHEVKWGKELQTEHERYLADKLYKRPTIVYNYPLECKAFYMRSNDDGKTVAAMDILCPGIGELVGGAQREERLDVLDARLDAFGLSREEYWWYRDLRRYGSVPHAGFGVGFERLVMLCTGVNNIRDAIPFPRYPGHAHF